MDQPAGPAASRPQQAQQQQHQQQQGLREQQRPPHRQPAPRAAAALGHSAATAVSPSPSPGNPFAGLSSLMCIDNPIFPAVLAETIESLVADNDELLVNDTALRGMRFLYVPDPSPSVFTLTSCGTACRKRSYPHAAIERLRTCLCFDNATLSVLAKGGSACTPLTAGMSMVTLSTPTPSASPSHSPSPTVTASPYAMDNVPTYEACIATASSLENDPQYYPVFSNASVTMDPLRCIQLCSILHKSHAGLRNNECWCIHDSLSGASQLSDCAVCSGQSVYKCGKTNRLAAYSTYFNAKPISSSSVPVNTPTASDAGVPFQKSPVFYVVVSTGSAFALVLLILGAVFVRFRQVRRSRRLLRSASTPASSTSATAGMARTPPTIARSLSHSNDHLPLNSRATTSSDSMRHDADEPAAAASRAIEMHRLAAPPRARIDPFAMEVDLAKLSQLVGCEDATALDMDAIHALLTNGKVLADMAMVSASGSAVFAHSDASSSSSSSGRLPQYPCDPGVPASGEGPPGAHSRRPSGAAAASGHRPLPPAPGGHASTSRGSEHLSRPSTPSPRAVPFSSSPARRGPGDAPAARAARPDHVQLARLIGSNTDAIDPQAIQILVESGIVTNRLQLLDGDAASLSAPQHPPNYHEATTLELPPYTRS